MGPPTGWWSRRACAAGCLFMLNRHLQDGAAISFRCTGVSSRNPPDCRPTPTRGGTGAPGGHVRHRAHFMRHDLAAEDGHRAAGKNCASGKFWTQRHEELPYTTIAGLTLTDRGGPVKKLRGGPRAKRPSDQLFRRLRRACASRARSSGRDRPYGPGAMQGSIGISTYTEDRRRLGPVPGVQLSARWPRGTGGWSTPSIRMLWRRKVEGWSPGARRTTGRA